MGLLVLQLFSLYCLILFINFVIFQNWYVLGFGLALGTIISMLVVLRGD